jgi:hypothetical protein
MTKTLPENSEVTERKSVMLSDAERRNLRRKLQGSVGVAQDVLNPRTQLTRLVVRGKAEAKRVAADTAKVARKNAPVIGVIGLSALIFAARRPISDWISKVRTSRSKTPNGD